MIITGNRHLPAADDTRSEHWTAYARCNGVNTEIFFPTRANCADAYLAKRFCDACTVAPQCLAAALEAPRTCGVFAGRFFDQGNHREIIPLRTPPPDRHDAARDRRIAAYGHYRALLAEGLSPAAARRLLARREKVDESTVRVWVRKTRAESEEGPTAP